MKRGWFGPKLMGWGVSPKTWQGWFVTVAWVAGLAVGVRYASPLVASWTGCPRPMIVIAFTVILLSAFAAVIALTYERNAD